MTATRFTTANLTTAAIRDLAEHQANLEIILAAVEADARTVAEKLTIGELKEQTEVSQRRKAPTTKAEWVELYVKRVVAAAPEAKELSAKKQEAAFDQMFADRLNRMLNASDEADEMLRKVVNESSGVGMFRNLTWKLDDAFIAQAAARYARQVFEAVVEDDAELREAALKVLFSAMATIFSFPSHVRANGLSGGYRMASLIEASAANTFRQAVAQYLRADMVPASLIAY